MSNKEFNLFIKPTEVEDVIANKDDKSTAYIILQNNTLHSKHLEMLEELKEVTNEKDELESLNESLDRSKSCLQGIAKNQYLLSQEKSKQVEYYKRQVNTMYMQSEFLHFLTLPYILLIMFHISNFKILIASVICITTVQINAYYENHLFIKNLSKNEDIKKIEDEIKTLDKSNDHLHELIDNF